MAQVHVSGHACQEELKLMLSMIKPQYFIPVHGEERHLYSHADLAYNMGYKKKNVFIPQLGMPIELRKKSAKYGEAVESGIVMIDGLGVGDVGSIVLKDRQVLSQDGLFVVVLTMSKGPAWFDFRSGDSFERLCICERSRGIEALAKKLTSVQWMNVPG